MKSSALSKVESESVRTAKLASVKSGASAKSKDSEHMRKRNRMKKRLANFIEDEAVS